MILAIVLLAIVVVVFAVVSLVFVFRFHIEKGRRRRLTALLYYVDILFIRASNENVHQEERERLLKMVHNELYCIYDARPDEDEYFDREVSSAEMKMKKEIFEKKSG